MLDINLFRTGVLQSVVQQHRLHAKHVHLFESCAILELQRRAGTQTLSGSPKSGDMLL
jgi:hypothetical protein